MPVKFCWKTGHSRFCLHLIFYSLNLKKYKVQVQLFLNHSCLLLGSTYVLFSPSWYMILFYHIEKGKAQCLVLAVVWPNFEGIRINWKSIFDSTWWYSVLPKNLTFCQWNGGVLSIFNKSNYIYPCSEHLIEILSIFIAQGTAEVPGVKFLGKKELELILFSLW